MVLLVLITVSPTEDALASIEVLLVVGTLVLVDITVSWRLRVSEVKGWPCQGSLPGTGSGVTRVRVVIVLKVERVVLVYGGPKGICVGSVVELSVNGYGKGCD